MNDDVKPAEGHPYKFTPEAGSGTQCTSCVSGYSGNPGAVNTGPSVSRRWMCFRPAKADIEGTPNADKLTGTDDSESIAGLEAMTPLSSLSGDDGNDLLIGGPGADDQGRRW